MFEQMNGYDDFSLLSDRISIHTEHRWTLALIYLAQEKGLVPRPCNLISFDRHMDSLPPLNADRVTGTPLDDDSVLSLCDIGLSPKDDDWIQSAMELGLVSDAVVFGFHDKDSGLNKLDNGHVIVGCTPPGGALDYQGDLSDGIRRTEPLLANLWRILGWTGNGFDPDRPKPFVTIDLDCFAFNWREYTFPWPEEVFEEEFNKVHRCGWSGGQFCGELLGHAGFIDIAREPSCCGGDEKCRTILSDVNRFLFQNGLAIL